MLSAGGYGHLFKEIYRREGQDGGLLYRPYLSPGTILNSFCLVIGHFP